MSDRLRSDESVASVSSDATVKASNRGIKRKRKMTRLSDSQRESFTALRGCIHESQRMTLEFHLGMLANAIGSRSRNDVLACIGRGLCMDSHTQGESAIVAAFLNVVRDLASSAAIREMQALVRVATESSSDDSSGPTEHPPETPRDSSSFDSESTDNSSRPTVNPPEIPHDYSSFDFGSKDDSSSSKKHPRESPDRLSIDTESHEKMMRMAKGDDSIQWTVSDSDTLNGEQTETFDDPES